jgi:energy-coupling factor transport system permease protein
MRSPFAYVPRRRPLQAASPGAAVLYLGSLVAVAFVYWSPVVLVGVGIAVTVAGLLAGARRAVWAGWRMGAGLGLAIALINPLVSDRGETVLARLGDWPWLGRVDVTAEALVNGAVSGLLAAVTIVAFAVYSACVDPDRVLRSLRPLARHSALTATLVSRLVPVAAADGARLADAARLRGPGAAEVGRAPLARRLLAGSLDRAVDVAATLELRGYGLGAASEPRRRRRLAERLWGSQPPQLSNRGSRFDRRFYAIGVAVLLAGVAGKVLGAGAFHTYPAIGIEVGAGTVALAGAIALAGLAPLRRRTRRRGATRRPEAARV